MGFGVGPSFFGRRCYSCCRALDKGRSSREGSEKEEEAESSSKRAIWGRGVCGGEEAVVVEEARSNTTMKREKEAKAPPLTLAAHIVLAAANLW